MFTTPSFFKFLFLLATLTYASLSQAIECSTVSINYSFAPRTITVQRDLPVGQKIFAIGNPAAFAISYACSKMLKGENAFMGVAARLPFHSIIDGMYVYETSIPGVGFAIAGMAYNYLYKPGQPSYGSEPGSPTFITGSDLVPGIPHSVSLTNRTAARALDKDESYQFKSVMQIHIYKIGPITPGVFSGNIADLVLRDSNGATLAADAPQIFTRLEVQSVSCSVNTAAISVALPDVKVSDFTSVGRVLGEKSFPLALNCDAGANIKLTMRGARNPDTITDGVLKLTNAGAEDVATGVGIQILDTNRSPLVLDKQITLKDSAASKESFTFYVRYFQTKSKVTGGEASSTMTLDITYQ